MNRPLRALLIEDSEDDAVMIEHALRQGGFDLQAQRIESAQEMERALDEGSWDLILSDYVMPRFGALDALRLVRGSGHDVPFIIISGKIDEETAVGAMKAGAHDFVTKGNLARLAPAISRELEETDIRLRHRAAEFARLESEERYRRLAESISDVLFALDKSLRCTYWNKAAEDLTGTTSRSALGLHLSDLFSDLLDSATEALFRQVIESGSKANFSNALVIRGEQRWFEWSVYPSPDGISVIASDITAKKKSEELRRAHQDAMFRLEQAKELRILGQLTSGVAHEVRNPLNAISVVTEAMFQELGDRPDLDEYKEHVRTHVGRLKQLMQDLLELGRPIDRARMKVIPVRSLVESAADMWHTGGHTNTCSAELGYTLVTPKPSVCGDLVRLQQVLINVLDNAAQHSPAGSAIRVQTLELDGTVEITVTDSGSGIDPEHLPQVFTPFFTTRKKGTGLGLSIVRHMIDCHGGTITIVNNEGTPGCTVRILLPLFTPDLSKQPEITAFK